MKKLPFVKVVWNDAWGKAEDNVNLENVAATHDPVVVTTLGWLLLSDAKGVSLANEFYEDYYRGRTFIPRGMVVTETEMRIHKRAKRGTKRTAKAATVDSVRQVNEAATSTDEPTA